MLTRPVVRKNIMFNKLNYRGLVGTAW